MKYNPASVHELLALAMGSLEQGRGGNSLVARLRYFDADQRRPGLPKDVAALVERMTADEAVVTLVNVNQVQPRHLIIQGGAYGEHEIVAIAGGKQDRATEGRRDGETLGRRVTVKLDPGAGAKLMLRMKRHVNQPTFELPWE
jgi:hypothetical protein